MGYYIRSSSEKWKSKIQCRKAVLVVALSFIMALPGVAGLPLYSDEGNRSGIPSPVGDHPLWYDPLDDVSHVYVLSTGLVGVEVVGGEARLKAGYDKGWLASEVIECPVGYRYDYVHLDVQLPGSSYVEISETLIFFKAIVINL